MLQRLRSWSQVSLSSQACHSFKVFKSKPGFSHSTSSSSWEINPQKKLAWGKYEGLQIQFSESCRVMLILNRFHCCPMPEILQQVEVQPICQKGPEVVIFQLVKQRSYFLQQLCMPCFSSKTVFWGQAICDPPNKRFERQYTHAFNYAAISRCASATHPRRQKLENTELDSI